VILNRLHIQIILLLILCIHSIVLVRDITFSSTLCHSPHTGYMEEGKAQVKPLTDKIQEHAEKIHEQQKPFISEIEKQFSPLSDNLQAQLMALVNKMQAQFKPLADYFQDQMEQLFQGQGSPPPQ
uniref:Apolipoprotein A-IV a n=1 Tax=Oncorhynchus kisutch TaxID=8019 RepID=A0A8C7GLX3_ONCKI